MRAIIIGLILCLTWASLAQAQTEDDVRQDVMAALSTPLPITVIGPLIARDVLVVKEGDGFRATLVEPMLMGIVPLSKMSFKMIPTGDNLYRVTDFNLPQKLDLFNSVTLALGTTQFDGVWSTKTRSYQSLGFQLNDLSVIPNAGADVSKVSIGSLSLNVVKEGEVGATESKFAIKASDITSKGFPPNNIKIANLVAELIANGEEPVDLYSVISRFVVLTAMQQNADAALTFAESLRAKRYDTAILNLRMEGVDVEGSEPGSNQKLLIAEVMGAIGLTNVSPEEWGTVSVKFNGTKIYDNGVFGTQEMNMDSGTLALEGARIPIGATLNAIAKMQNLSRGEAVSFRFSELLDGLLNMGALKLSSGATDVSYVPIEKDDPVFHISSYSLETGTEGFRDSKGKFFFDTAVEGLDVKLSKFNYSIEEKAYRLLNPKLLRYNFSVSELNEPLLRKLMADVVIKNADDYVALAAPALAYFMALKPLVETTDAHYQSEEVDASLSGLVRFYPAWVLEALPYEGKSTIKISGLEKVSALLDEYMTTPSDQGGISAPDKVGMIVGQSFISTFRALAATEGQNQVWNIIYPNARQGLLLVNDIELRFPSFTTYLAPMLMGTGMFNSSPPVEELLPPTNTVQEPPAMSP
jgi:hypothetical protein